MNQDAEDEAVISALDYEAIEVKCLLLEPQGYVSIYGVLGAGEESAKNSSEMDDVPCGSGMPGRHSAQEGKENVLNKETLHTRRNEVEVAKFQVHNELSVSCEDYLLDIEFSEISCDVDPGASRGSHSSLLKSQLPFSSCGKIDTLGMSGQSGAILQVTDCTDSIFGPSNSELHGISCQDYGCEMSVEYKWSKSPNSFATHNYDKAGDVSSLLISPMCSDKAEDVSSLLTGHMCSGKNDTNPFVCPSLPCGGTFDAAIKEYDDSKTACKDAETGSPLMEELLSESSAQVSSIDLPSTPKRPRKPTRRYVDESAEIRPILKKRVPSSTSKRKIVREKCEKDIHTRQRTAKLLPEESSAKPIQVPFGPLVGRECSKRHPSSEKREGRESSKKHPSGEERVVRESSKKHPSGEERVVRECSKRHPSRAVRVPDSDIESSMDEWENNCVPKVKSEEERARRKHHRLWTIAEVKKLIEGVGQYGVGKWSDIKSHFFSSSVHRTPVDLKDKWRNLLKASHLQTGGDNKRSLSWRPLPKSVLNRVKELATIYPYPRILKSKVSRISKFPLPSPKKTDASPNSSRRNVHQKSGT